MQFFFSNWLNLARIFLGGVIAYIAVVAFLRVSGNRTLSKMNAFDLVITVALGSTLATVILSREVPIIEGVIAIGLLIALQWLIAWLVIRSDTVEYLTKANPKLLMYRGQYLEDVMRRERVVKAEMLQAMRSSGIAKADDVEAIVLETDGSFSVIPAEAGKADSSLANVDKPDNIGDEQG